MENEKSKYKISLGERLKKAADKIGGGVELSKKTAIPRSTLEYYFTGKTEPKSSQINDISLVSGLSVTWLITGKGMPDGSEAPLIKHPPLKENLIERIRECAKRAGSLPALAALSGVPESAISDMLNGKKPHLRYLDPIACAGGVDTEWLLTGKGSIARVISMDEELTLSSNVETSDASIPVVSVEASAGGGFNVLEENVISWIKFDKTWLYNTWHLTPSELFCIPTTGESMEPTIQAGEYLLASRAEHRLKSSDGIYIIRLEGGVLVKRLQFLPGKKVLVSSDNSAYKPYEITLDDGIDFEMLGKVMLVIKQV